ncbi:MAG: DUF3667 domain-containing protein [Robiginitomaculum sp.]|nr:DUF3667 domain-containing protein [Robiginitomaculum sp.]
MSTDIGENEEGIALALAEAGDKKPTPGNNTAVDCKSCGAAIEKTYCGNCGQKNDDLRRSLWRLIGESLGGLFSFEGRMWRTWAALLFKPGKVAYAYANGARSRYSPPIRVYLVVSFMFFGFLALTQTNLFAVSVQPKTNIEAVKQQASEPVDKEKTGLELTDYNYQLLFFQTQKEFESIADNTLTDGILKTMQGYIAADTTNAENSLDAESIKAIKTFLQNPDKFNAAFNTWLPRVMFFMVPFAMLLGAIFIRGPTALLYDHLIHAMYIHAVFFMTLLLAVLLAKVLPGSMVAKVLVVMFMIYLPISLKRMFKRGWFKTILTTLVVSMVYGLFLFSAIILISVYSIANLST